MISKIKKGTTKRRNLHEARCLWRTWRLLTPVCRSSNFPQTIGAVHKNSYNSYNYAQPAREGM